MIAAFLSSASSAIALAAPGDPLPAPDNGGDVTETIGADEADGGAGTKPEGEGDLVETFDDAGTSAPKAAPSAAKPDKFEFRGFARATAGVGVDGVGNAPGVAPQERAPFDRAFSEQHLYVDMRYARGAWFQAVISGSLALSEYYQENQASSGAPTSGFDYQRLEAIAREAYVAFFLGRLDLRIGQQRVAWGNSDAYAPNDVLNGRDVRSPFLFDPEMIALPSPAVRADLDMDFAVASLVVEPFLVTDKIDIYGTNWALAQDGAPEGYRRLFGTLAQGQDRASVSALQGALTGGQLSPSNPADASIGTSLRTHLGSVDMSYYFMSGFDHTPAIYVDPAFQKQLETLEPGQLNGAVLDATLNQARASSKAFGGPVLVSYRRSNHVGMDAQTTLGSFVLRADLAYDSAKTFFAADTLNAVIRPAAQEVVGLEYQTGSFNKLVGVELWAMQVLGPEVQYVPNLALNGTSANSLLWYRDNNLGVANVIRWSFFENTIVEVRSNIGLTPTWFLIRPEIGWDTPTFTVRAGFLGIGGEDGSLGFYYRRNSTAYLTSRISF